MQNQSHYDATSNGVSAGVGSGNTGKAIGPGSVSNTGSVAPMMSQNDSGDSGATTRSAIGAGAINVTNQVAQTQDVASLSRDTTHTSGSVSQTPDVNNLLSQQADTMQAAQAAGQVVAQGIGMYADSKRDTATDQATHDAWDEGGDNRTALHVLGGALVGGLGGGSAFSAVGGAAGAYVASSAAKGLAEIANGVDSATGSQLIGNLAANVVAGLGGALVGGTAGAAAASNVHLYNQSLDDERQLTGESRSSNPLSQSPLNLILQSIANGLSAIFGMPGEPPATSAGAVLVNEAGQVAKAGVGTPGYGAGNATLHSGNGDGQSASGQSGGSSDGKSPAVVDNARAGHIFRDSEGHLADTPANRTLLEQVANDPGAVAGTDKYGTVWSSTIQSDGTQVWVGVRNGKVSYGGVNQIPKEFNSQTGFSSPTKPGG